jgi:hypothetical protein
MFDRKLNGILADEMGLGKTIQTISLLAHLACEKGKELGSIYCIVVTKCDLFAVTQTTGHPFPTEHTTAIR